MDYHFGIIKEFIEEAGHYGRCRLNNLSLLIAKIKSKFQHVFIVSCNHCQHLCQAYPVKKLVAIIG